MENNALALEIKICGLTSSQDTRAAIEAGADFCGFVYCRSSPRHMEPEAMAELAAIAAEQNIPVVAVVSNADSAALSKLASHVRPDIIQFHGGETPEQLSEFGQAIGECRIWKAIPVKAESDIRGGQCFAGIAERLLLDAAPPTRARRSGGLGNSFDWSLLARAKPIMPWLLAGGLDPDNVARAVLATGAVALDVSSGVESVPGRKDSDKMRRFVYNARGATA